VLGCAGTVGLLSYDAKERGGKWYCSASKDPNNNGGGERETLHLLRNCQSVIKETRVTAHPSPSSAGREGEVRTSCESETFRINL